MSTETKLLPCPFCGEAARLLGGPMAQETYGVWCKNSHSIGGTMDAKQTIERWNTRAPAQGEPNPREAILESEVKRLTDRLETLAAGFGVPDGGKYIADWQTRIKKFQAMSAALAPEDPAPGEPIAWRWRSLAGGDWNYRDGKDNPAGSFGPIEVEPLYAAHAPHAGEAVREALRPFAAVAAADIGPDEHDGDMWTPIRNNLAPRLTVGDLRAALAALAPIPDERGGVS